MAEEQAGGARPPIAFPITAPGAQETSQSFAQLYAAMMKANEGLVALSQSAKQASTGLEPANQNARKTNESLKDLNQQAQQTNGSLSETARGVGRLAPAFAALGASITRSTPEIGGFVQALGRIGGTVNGFTAIIGGGAGLVAGGAVAAIGLLSEALRNAKTEEEAFAEAVEKSTKALQEQEQAAKIEAIKKDPAFFAALAKAGGQTGFSQDDAKKAQIQIGVQLTQARDRLLELQRAEQAGARFNAVQTAQFNALKKKVDDLEQASKALSEFSSEVGKPPPPKPPPVKAVKQGDGTTAEGRAEFNREQAALAAAEAQQTRLQSLDQQRIESAKQAQQTLTELERAGNEARMLIIKHNAEQGYAALNQMRSQYVQAAKLGALDEIGVDAEKNAKIIQLAEFREANQKRLDQQRKQSNAELTNMANEAWESAAAVGIQSLAAVAKGQKVTTKQILASLGDEMVASGTHWLFEGIIRSAAGLPGGPVMVGAATAEIAAGLALDAASAGAPGVSGFSGNASATRDSSPGGAVYWDPTTSRFVRGSPYAPVPGPAAPAGGATIYQTNNYHSTFAPRREDAEAMVRATGEGLRSGVMGPNWAQTGT